MSTAQKNMVNDVMRGFREKLGGLFRGLQSAGQDREARRQAFAKLRPKMEALGKERDAKLAAILSPTQKKKLAAMQGPKFNFPQRRPRGRRPGAAA